jgi:thiol-disulfide isomerase/thioredoxin
MPRAALRLDLLRPTLALLVTLGTGCAAGASHGVRSHLSSVAGPGAQFCEHDVPAEVCTRCNPELVGKFKAVRDWCPPHDRPESQCLICHPDLTFEPLPELAATADVVDVDTAKPVADLSELAVPGRVTIVDFTAAWCAACQNVELSLRRRVNAGAELSVRRVRLDDWEGPWVERFLADVPSLPYLVVLGPDGVRRGEIRGFDATTFEQALDGLIAPVAP